MATYNINSSVLPSQFSNGDIIIAPYSGSVKSLSLPIGTFTLEVEGAQGGYRSSSTYGGKGGYTKGTLTLTSPQTVYLRTGGQGNSDTATSSIYQGGFNGGGKRYSYHGGGGASDIRIGTDSLYARVIVAGGGGSDGATSRQGMYGGGDTGGSSTQSYGSGGYGGTQTGNTWLTTSQSSAATSQSDCYAGFGFGGNGVYYASGYGGAGGGGWYGGSGAYPDGSGDDDRGGGGGSGYVYTSSTASSYPSGVLLNSSYYLTNTTLTAGNASFTDPETGSTVTGRTGNGYIKITVVSVTYSYTITSSAGSNGSISPSGSTTVSSGGSQTYTITPNTNYKVSNVLVDGTSVGAVTTYTFSNVSANHTISATFALITYTITSSAGANGTIFPLGTQTVTVSNSITFTITPNNGYSISDVLVDGSSVGSVSTYTFSNVSANHTISATFVLNHIIMIYAIGTDFGTVSPTGSQSVADGGSITLTFSMNGSSSMKAYVNGIETTMTSPYTISNITQNTTVYFAFSKPVWSGLGTPFPKLLQQNTLIPTVYLGSTLVAQYNFIYYEWLLTATGTAVSGYEYIWDDSKSWNDSYYWTETVTITTWMFTTNGVPMPAYEYVWDDTQSWNDSTYLTVNATN